MIRGFFCAGAHGAGGASFVKNSGIESIVQPALMRKKFFLPPMHEKLLYAAIDFR